MATVVRGYPATTAGPEQTKRSLLYVTAVVNIKRPSNVFWSEYVLLRPKERACSAIF